MTQYKEDMLYYLHKWNPFLIEQMRNCSHHYSYRSLNPFHLEGDCFAHTMMVLNNIGNLSSDDRLLLSNAICALIHDTGKPLTRNPVKPGPGKVSFFSHGYASVQYAIDFVKYLVNINYLTHSVAEEILKNILPVISHHMELYDENTGFDKMYELCNCDHDTACIAAELGMADLGGSFGYREFDEYRIDKFNEFYTFIKKQEQMEFNDDPDIIVWCGVPSSGKDTHARNASNYIFSYDEIRKEVLMNDYPERDANETPGEFYAKAFQYCNSKKVNLDKILYDKIYDILYNKIHGTRSNNAPVVTPISICNTSLAKKSRNVLLNNVIYPIEKQLTGKLSIQAILVCCDYELSVKADANRKEKTVTEGVVRKFATNIQVPSVHEGFHSVKFKLR